MTYVVSFEADQVPAGIPANAKIVKKSVLPVVVKPLGDREIKLTDGGRLSITEIGYHGGREVYAYPNVTDARKLIEGLQEIAGVVPAPPVPVELPSTVETSRSRRIRVEARTIAKGARLTVEKTGGYDSIASLLDEHEARELRDALSAALGD